LFAFWPSKFLFFLRELCASVAILFLATAPKGGGDEAGEVLLRKESSWTLYNGDQAAAMPRKVDEKLKLNLMLTLN